MRAEQVKLVVKWCSLLGKYECTHPNTNVVGHGKTPAAAIEDWQFWWTAPY